MMWVGGDLWGSINCYAYKLYRESNERLGEFNEVKRNSKKI